MPRGRPTALQARYLRALRHCGKPLKVHRGLPSHGGGVSWQHDFRGLWWTSLDPQACEGMVKAGWIEQDGPEVDWHAYGDPTGEVVSRLSTWKLTPAGKKLAEEEQRKAAEKAARKGQHA
jgi:hypothetical protein